VTHLPNHIQDWIVDPSKYVQKGVLQKAFIRQIQNQYIKDTSPSGDYESFPKVSTRWHSFSKLESLFCTELLKNLPTSKALHRRPSNRNWGERLKIQHLWKEIINIFPEKFAGRQRSALFLNNITVAYYLQSTDKKDI